RGNYVSAVAASPDGRTVVSATQNQIHFWDAAERRLLKTLKLETEVSPLVFSPDGKRFAAGEFRLTGGKAGLRVWEWPSAKFLRALPPSAAFLYDTVAFSPDGNALFALNLSGLEVWDLATGEERYRLNHFHRKENELFG